MSKTEIKKVVLDIDGKEISLTVDQAKKLKELLSDMFGKEIIKEVIVDHRHHYDWYLKPYQIWCGTSAVEYKQNAVYCSLGATSSQPTPES